MYQIKLENTKDINLANIEKLIKESNIKNIKFINESDSKPYYKDIIYESKENIKYCILNAGGEKKVGYDNPIWFSRDELSDVYEQTFLFYIKKAIKYFGEEKELVLCWIKEPETITKHVQCHHCGDDNEYYQIYSRFFVTTKEILKKEIDQQFNKIFGF